MRDAKEQGIYLAEYVRERIKEHLGDTAALNGLSGDHRARLEALCRPSPGEAAEEPADGVYIKEVV